MSWKLPGLLHDGAAATRKSKWRQPKVREPGKSKGLDTKAHLPGNAGVNGKHALIVLASYASLYVLFFAPVLFSNRLLAPGDGLIYFLPNFLSPRVFWDPAIWGGFPAFADAQQMLWYPPAMICSLFGSAGFQIFVLTAYVMASSFTYGYVFTLTRSRLAAAVSGCVYGLSGFMLAHLGHAALIHAAAWLPLVIWSFANLQRETVDRFWFAIAVLAVACAALAGHPQIFVYISVLTAAFAIVTGWRAPLGRWRYFVICAVVYLLGVGLAALQLWPTSELTRLSWRAAMSFDEFTAYALTLRQVAGFVFPFLYGGAPGTIYGTPYFGAWPSGADGWGLGEVSGYAGLLPLLLAFIGLIAYRRNGTARFWLGVSFIAFLLILGATTPLAKVTYHIAVLNKFRAPARHFLELTFALGVLSGFGVSAIQKQTIDRSFLRRTILGVIALVGLCVLSLLLFRGKIEELAIQRLGRGITLTPWKNPSIFLPLGILVVVCIVLSLWHRLPKQPARIGLLLLVLVIDLGSFGWFLEWHYRAPSKSFLHAPTAAESYRANLNATHQRILPVRGGTGQVSELPPNLSKLWGVPSASGYGPFILTRLSRLLTMPPHGSVDESWRDPTNRSLDLMAVRYLITPPEEIEPQTISDSKGIRWSVNDFNVQLGTGCDPKNPSDFDLDLPQPARATRLGIVSALACSVALADKQPFATVTLTDVEGGKKTVVLTAGHDGSEWAYDCGDVRPALRQERATIFRSYPVTRGNVKCDGYDYVTVLPVEELKAIKRIELHWTAPAGTLALKKLTSIDDSSRISTPINPVAGSLDDQSHWRRVGEIKADNGGYAPSESIGTGVVFENLRALPRAWLAPTVEHVSADEAFAAVRSSRLADGRTFDPARVALVEEEINFHERKIDSGGQVQVMRLDSRVMEVRTISSSTAFLVTSDVLYPGWRATVDDAATRLYQADYALRGVVVPAGMHTVRFEFRPATFYYGAVASVMALLLFILCAIYAPRLSLRRDLP